MGWRTVGATAFQPPGTWNGRGVTDMALGPRITEYKGQHRGSAVRRREVSKTRRESGRHMRLVPDKTIRLSLGITPVPCAAPENPPLYPLRLWWWTSGASLLAWAKWVQGPYQALLKSAHFEQQLDEWELGFLEALTEQEVPEGKIVAMTTRAGLVLDTGDATRAMAAYKGRCGPGSPQVPTADPSPRNSNAFSEPRTGGGRHHTPTHRCQTQSKRATSSPAWGPSAFLSAPVK